MIYIFDDNKHGQLSSNYKIDFLEFFRNNSTIIKHISEHSDYRLSELLNYAKCVLIHYSFPDDLKTEHVKAICKENNIPLVIFSNQYTGTVFASDKRNYISQIKKDRLYFNLNHFIDNYIHHGEIRLELLALGKNYEAEKAFIILNRLSLFLFTRISNFSYYRNFESEKNEWKDLKELYYFALPETDFETIEEELEFVSAPDLLTIIKSLVTKILEKYG
jgi:hypothetical protein